MDLALIEGIAVAFYRERGHEPDLPVSTFSLAREWLGADAIVSIKGIVGAQATTFIQEGRRRIAVTSKLPRQYQRFLVGHEIAHLLFERENYSGEDLERCCDTLGAALMAPIPCVIAMRRAFGDNFAEHAAEAGCTETQAALRLAEVLHIPRAIITPQKLYVRGPDEFVWPEEGAIRSLAKARVLRPGLRKSRLGDDPRRWVIDVDELEAV